MHPHNLSTFQLQAAPKPADEAALPKVWLHMHPVGKKRKKSQRYRSSKKPKQNPQQVNATVGFGDIGKCFQPRSVDAASESSGSSKEEDSSTANDTSAVGFGHYKSTVVVRVPNC